MKIETLHEAFAHKIGAIYSTETQIVDKGLPSMIEAAADQKLIEGFKMHLKESVQQLKRLDQVINLCKIERENFMTCPITKQMIQTTEMMVGNTDKGPVRDVLLIAAAQGVEHHEIAAYGTLVELAKKMGHKEAAALLQETLDEEEATDKKLNEVANNVNEAALAKASGMYTKKSAA